MADDDAIWDDACLTYKRLRNAYYRLISGSQEEEVEYLANGVTRRVRYGKTDLTALENAMNQAQAECQAATGVEPLRRRFAIQGGSGRTRL